MQEDAELQAKNAVIAELKAKDAVIAELKAKAEVLEAKYQAEVQAKLTAEIEALVVKHREELAAVRKQVHDDELLEKAARFEMPEEPFPNSPWAEHRLKVNQLLAKQPRKAMGKRGREEEDEGVACSSMSWPKLKSLYLKMMRKDSAAFPLASIEDERFGSMLDALRQKNRTRGSIYEEVSEMHRRAFIAVIIGSVCDLFETKPLVEEEEPLRTPAVLANGVADFLVTHKRRRLLVVEAKRDDFDQGRAQDFLMMEMAIAMNEADAVPCEEICGVVTNYEKWL